MMKKLLMTAASGLMAYAAIGQACTPDPNYTPSSATGAGISNLPCAVINQAYDEQATIVIPPSINGADLGLPIPGTIYICRVTVTSITNIPANSGLNTPIVYKGVTYGFGQEITLDPTVDRACVSVQSTGFTVLFDDSLRAQGTVDVSTNNCATIILNDLSFDEISPGGIPIAFKVKATQAECDATMGIEETISNNSFDVAQNFPNPFNGDSQIAFNLPQSGKVTFRITNLVGKTVKEVNMNGNAGANYITISSADYAAGVYMYSVSANGKTVTKRMIIK